MNTLMVVLMIQIFYVTLEYELRCPLAKEWLLRPRKLLCGATQYVCLLYLPDNIYHETCDGLDYSSRGSKLVFEPNFNKARCNFNRFQPFPFSTDGSSECVYQKSFCNEEGQFVFLNGSLLKDTSCGCNFSKGYIFVTKPRNICYCIPSEEDCSCYSPYCDDKGNHCPRDDAAVKNTSCSEIMAASLPETSYPIPDSFNKNKDYNNRGGTFRLYRVYITSVILVILVVTVPLFVLVANQSISCMVQKEKESNERDLNLADNSTSIEKEETISQWKQEKVAETRAIRRLMEMIETDSIAMAVGPPGCGKSTAIHYIALQLALKQEYEIIILQNPEDMIITYNPDCKQVFVIDDVYGIGTFDENKAMKWLEKSNDIKKILNCNEAKFLSSCRSHIFQHRIAKTIGILSDFSCDFVSSDYSLTDDEKERIATLYLTNDEIRLLKPSNVFSISDFLPVMCRLYRYQTSANIVNFFSNPTKAVSDEFLLLFDANDRTTFSTLLLFIAFNNCIMENLFSDILENHSILQDISVFFNLEQKFTIEHVKNEMQKLSCSYLKYQNKTYTLIHDKIFEILVYFCGKHMFDFLLEVAHTDVIRNRFAFQGLLSESANHELVVDIPFEKEVLYFDRLKKDIKCGFIQNVFSNQNLNNKSFRCKFITHIANDIVVSLAKETLFSLIMTMMDKGFSDIVSIVLTQILNQINNDEQTPPLKPECKEHPEVAKVIVKKSDPNMCNTENESPLFLASRSGFIDVLELLLDHDSNPNVCNKDNESPLFVASSEGHFETVKLLLEHRCDSNVCNKDNESPMLVALRRGYTNIVKLLLDHGGDPNVCNKDNESPMLVASRGGYTDIVKLFLDQNCDPNVCNKDRESPMLVASRGGYADIVKLLLDHH